jgi:hypothetical protein
VKAKRPENPTQQETVQQRPSSIESPVDLSVAD